MPLSDRGQTGLSKYPEMLRFLLLLHGSRQFYLINISFMNRNAFVGFNTNIQGNNNVTFTKDQFHKYISLLTHSKVVSE